MRAYASLTTAGQARRHRRTAVAALTAYGITPVSVRQLAVHTNFVFRIDTASGRRYALRVQRPWGVDPAITDLELWFVEQLADHGLPVARPVPTPSGEVAVVVDATEEVPDAHRCVLFEWLPGGDADDTSDRYWTNIGDLAGRLHAVSGGLTLPAGAPRRRWDRVYYFGEDPAPVLALPALTGPMRATLDAVVPLLDEALASIYTDRTAAPFLVHGDLHDGNVRSRRGGLAVFDFEDYVSGYAVHDLAVALYGPFYNRPDYEAVVRLVRGGYERHLPWPVDDPAEMRTLFAARVVVLVEYCLLMGPEYHRHLPMLIGRLEEYRRT